MLAPPSRRARARELAALVALLVVPLVVARLVGHAPAPAPPADVGAWPPVHVAFFAIFAAIIGAIWNGLQVAGRVTLQILAWSVKALWLFATTIYDGLKVVSRFVTTAGLKVWDFFRFTYENVLRPAWDFLWKLFDRVRRLLEKVFRPVFRFLQVVKDHLLGFYTKWIRPILDTIDIARRILSILASLGLDVARTLDRKLAAIEQKIDAPFRYVLAKLNEVINLVNRVVTLDGLIQRVALIRSLVRDIGYVWRALINSVTAASSAPDAAFIAERTKARTIEEVQKGLRTYLETGGGDAAPLIDEMSAQYRIYFE